MATLRAPPPAAAAADGSIEENAMAILDTAGIKDARDLHDDRCAFLETVRSACLAADSPSPPSWRMYNAVFQILQDSSSLELTMASFHLLMELGKQYPRAYLTDSGSGQALVAVKESWSPFHLCSDVGCGEIGGNTRHLDHLFDSSRFSSLIEDMIETANDTDANNGIEHIKNIVLLEYLVSTLEADFVPRHIAYKESLDWVIFRESLLQMLLVSRKVAFKSLVKNCMSLLHQQKQPRLLLKLDISKAFDSVSWPFLLEVLRKLGFGQIWCDILCGLLSSSSTQVLLNGVPGNVIVHLRGLRQGDPLSPMLFILVMDVLSRLVSKAAEEGLLQPLSSRALQHRISIYADDTVIFLRPAAGDMNLIVELLQLFGEASGLRTNLQKSNVFPINCSEDDCSSIQECLPCAIVPFPCTYLGLPLSLKKLTRDQIQPYIDKIADRLSSWKANLLTKAGRKVLAQFVLTSMLIYLAMAVDLPPWAIKAVDKIRRGFLWRGRKDVRGGHCLLAWEKTCRPPELGITDITDLQKMCWALRVRWLWLRKTEPDKPWSVFPVQVHKCAQALFSTATVTEIGDGSDTLFWSDRWLLGKNLAELAPLVFALVPKRRVHKRTVQEALTDNTWVSDIQGALSVAVILEFLQLWDLITETVVLQPGTANRHVWRFSPTGSYSAKSAYELMFQGATFFLPWQRIWRSWAPSKCHFFMWLVAHNRCWTADRLASRGLPHPLCCPLCDQLPETINHLLIGCVFAREFWFCLLRKVGLHALAPQSTCSSFDDWWSSVSDMVDGETRQGLNSVIILGAWLLWTHRNRCVFDGLPPSISSILIAADNELKMWSLAGARGISYLVALVSG